MQVLGWFLSLLLFTALPSPSVLPRHSTKLLVLIVPGSAQAEARCLNRVAGGAIDNVEVQFSADALPQIVCLGCAQRCRGWGAPRAHGSCSLTRLETATEPPLS